MARSDVRVGRARQLRGQMTPAERKLWLRLKNMSLPQSHFRRQAPIGPFVVDFACHKSKLVVEIDGGHHANEPHLMRDARRVDDLKARGYRVLRFWNHDVLQRIDVVLDTIFAAATDPHFDCESVRRDP